MNKKGLTTTAVRQINRAKVYSSIYRNKITSKSQIVQDLQMSLSTVSQNLRALESEGLIRRNGFLDSTGGRKSHAIEIDPTARVAIGIGILKSLLHFVAVDLYGSVLYAETLQIPYRQEESYYRQIGCELEQFIAAHAFCPETILGVSIAVQGIISTDGQSVSYGAILNNEQMELKDLAAYIPYPCRLEHDSKAAGFLELWNHPEIASAAVFLLNRNLGGALIVNRQIHRGIHMRSGVVEHMCVDPDGPRCYCGKKGCLETFCSANALEDAAGMSIPEFFERKGQKDHRCLQVWDQYLNKLADAVRNVDVIVDGVIIISGYLAPYFTQEDVAALYQRINADNPFPIEEGQISFGMHGQYTPAVGAALFYIHQFIDGFSSN